jgi:glycosyltransferase involved in cell wall biosynthesis
MLDAPDENWPSMDLAGEMLLEQWRTTFAADVTVTSLSVPIRRLARRFPWVGATKGALNADRAMARYVAYPLRALAERKPGRLFHVVDHSYAQLVHALPAGRTGVYCHDLDAFLPIVSPAKYGRSPWFRALAQTLLLGVQSAAVVFHSTCAVAQALQSHGLVPRSRLVHAPYGVAREFDPKPDPEDGAERVLSSLGGRPFVLHIGSGIARKRLDILFEVFAHLRARHPGLQLVQQGAALSDTQKAQVDRLGIGDAILQPPKLDRRALAGLYRRAAALLVTSDAEGFCIPVIEALACGTIVVASDIPVLREVGGDAARYAPVGDIAAWTELVTGVIAGLQATSTRETRIAHAGRFTWEAHARTILAAYRNLADTR